MHLRVKRDIICIKRLETIPIPVYHRESGLLATLWE
nr:MAG TPA: hypothetical protein [Caudoviricetes sp.]